jgi:hypothetical protein
VLSGPLPNFHDLAAGDATTALLINVITAVGQRDVQMRWATPTRTIRRYDRSRHQLDRHPAQRILSDGSLRPARPGRRRQPTGSGEGGQPVDLVDH